MIQVLDKCVEDEFADWVEQDCFSNTMPWSFHKNIQDTEINELDDIQYGYGSELIVGNQINSNRAWQYSSILFSVLGHNVKQILMCRVFMMCPSLQPGVMNNVHIDLPNSPYPYKNMIYYVNDSDGSTLFFDNDKEIHRQPARKNTGILFDGSIPHCSTTPSKHRVVVNFCYLD